MALTLISTPLNITAADDAVTTISVTSGIDDTYDEYEFHFVGIHPGTLSTFITFQANASGEADFNETMTTTTFRAYHAEADNSDQLVYVASYDQAQGTAYQYISSGIGSDNDQSGSGVFTLYAPSSTTYVKHFPSRFVSHDARSAVAKAVDHYTAGYINTTAAIDEISFKMSNGNIGAGTIKMFGVS